MAPDSLAAQLINDSLFPQPISPETLIACQRLLAVTFDEFAKACDEVAAADPEVASGIAQQIKVYAHRKFWPVIPPTMSGTGEEGLVYDQPELESMMLEQPVGGTEFQQQIAAQSNTV